MVRSWECRLGLFLQHGAEDALIEVAMGKAEVAQRCVSAE